MHWAESRVGNRGEARGAVTRRRCRTVPAAAAPVARPSPLLAAASGAEANTASAADAIDAEIEAEWSLVSASGDLPRV